MKLLKNFQQDFDLLNKSLDSWKIREDLEFLLSQKVAATRVYKINCTGDVCVGDSILFVERIWQGTGYSRYSRKPSVLVGYEIREARVIKDSYGKEKQQHTFTLECSGKRKLIKGRNLYAVGVWRKFWKDENKRNDVIGEKHVRGDLARQERHIRRMNDSLIRY